MSAKEVYQKTTAIISENVDPKVDKSSQDRLSKYVIGTMDGKHGGPSQVARAYCKLGLGDAQVDSVERQIRRMENDPEITAEYCFYPMARHYLALGQPQKLILILDPTTKEDHIVMVSVNIWYRGRTLPLVWTIWPANTPLKGERFWDRIRELLKKAATIIPERCKGNITIIADRAFGSPAFTDLVEEQGWNWVVRVQDQTLCRDRMGEKKQIAKLVRFRGERKKLRGEVFKKAGWRDASVVVYWGKRHKKALCLVSNMKPGWEIIHIYRQRFPIECTFRDFKTYGWRWEQGQVRDLDHMERLLVGMAIATWIILMVGTWKSEQILSKPPTGNRHTRPHDGKLSIFQHGLDTIARWFHCANIPQISLTLSDWDAPNWSVQIRTHHAKAFVFAFKPYVRPS